MTRPAKKGRMVRVDDPTWDAAKRAAEDRGENLSDQIRRFLIRYARPRRQAPIPPKEHQQ